MAEAASAAHAATALRWAQWMARAQDGDAQAYACVLGELLAPLRGYVGRRVRDAAAAEDVVQDILLSLHRMRASYDPARPLLPWVYAIAQARTIDYLRRHAGQAAREVLDAEAGVWAGDAGADAERARWEAVDQLQVLMQALPGRQRRIVELVHLRQMSLADAAGESRLSVAAIKSILHRALLTLRKKARETP